MVKHASSCNYITCMGWTAASSPDSLAEKFLPVVAIMHSCRSGKQYLQGCGLPCSYSQLDNQSTAKRRKTGFILPKFILTGNKGDFSGTEEVAESPDHLPHAGDM